MSAASLSTRLTGRDLVGVAGMLAVFALLALRSAWLHSGVPDEVAVHAPGGFLYATTGRFAGGLGNPPLGMLWLAAPTALLGLDYQPFDESGLLAFRLPAIALGVLGGALVFALALLLHGRLAAFGSLLFYAFSPTLLAHGSLATLDVPVAVCVVGAVLCARRAAQHGRLRDFAWLGLAVGAACAVKVQGLAAAPLVAVQLLLARERAWRAGGALRTAGRAALAAGLAFAVLHLSYGALPGLGAGLMPEGFLEATERKLGHGARGHFGYLLGAYSTEGWWSYFPIALLVKTPLPLLVAAILGLLLRRDRDTLLWVVLPAALFFGAAASSSINIGVRHLLPMLPFLVILAGAGLAAVHERARIAAALMVLVHAGEALWASPHHLVYFNALGGGARGGYRILLDSNYDWGQHDPALRAHLRADEETAASALIDPDPLVPRAGRIFVGASALHGILGAGPRAYTWLRDREPEQRIAHTWFAYRVAPSEVPEAPVDARTAPQRVALARHALRAVELAVASGDPSAERAGAEACLAVYEYACALDLVRARLRRDPADRGAFYLGSELMARKRLGVLQFGAREYLDGFARLRAAEQWLAPSALAPSAARYEVGSALHQLHEILADSHSRRFEWTRALEQLELAAAAKPGEFANAYKLGWLLAAIPDDALRDGARAVALAREFGERTEWRTASSFDLLAAAQAEAGDWEAAVDAARAALERAGSSEEAASIRDRLAGYQALRAHRFATH